MKITPGKQKGLEAVSDKRGVIAAAAMDQRGSLQSAIAKDKGIDKKAVTAQMMIEFKETVTRVLTPHATAILLDPEYGLPAAKARSKNAGLILAYEKDRLRQYHARPPARPARPLVRAPPRGRRRRLRENPPLLHALRSRRRQRNQARLGRAHRRRMQALDVPFFLEFVGYEEGADEKAIEFARKKPEIVTRSMEEFSKPQYGVDVLKVEVPVNMAFVKGARASTRANPPIRATKPRNISAAPPPSPRSPSSIFPPASATTPLTNRSNSPPKPAPTSPASSAAAPPGKTASPSTPSRASRPSRTGSATRASPTSTT